MANLYEEQISFGKVLKQLNGVNMKTETCHLRQESINHRTLWEWFCTAYIFMSKLYICQQFFILSNKQENEGGFHFILALAIMLEALCHFQNEN